MNTLVEWSEVADGFTDVLVLGNGASIALDPAFSYASLLARAREAGSITNRAQAVFEYVGTEDFELVLNLLWHTVNINRALEVEEDRAEGAYQEVRSALVQTVRSNHASHENVSGQLGAASGFLQRFSIVHSLNYDLVVYWAMMEGNDHLGNWFKDCFVNGSFNRSWSRFRTAFRADGATLVFYPHGNLMLSTTLQGADRKLHRFDEWDDLLYRITTKWEEGDVVPLFVSEGSSTQKSRAIRRSTYLSTVYDDVLPDPCKSVVFHGVSFSLNDDHLVRQIARANPSRVAVSIFKGERDDDDVQADIDRIRRRLRVFFRGAEHFLYWAESDGAWIH
jgi:hypothetical protein